MKTHFKLKAFFLPGMILFLGACYSAEFFPTPDYPNLRRDGITSVEIRTTRPDRPFQKLGTLVFKDFTGDIRNSAFRSRIRRAAIERGGEGAWITRRSLHRQERFQTETKDRRSGRRGNTGGIRGKVGIVRIVLYNYEN